MASMCAPSTPTSRGRIGLVPQRPYLFSGTVASNLRYGKPDATDDELWDALTIAQGADFVEAMLGGLGARIAQGGTNVSGGQRQRLAIARDWSASRDLPFDDSFSKLDLATDARLRAAGPAHFRRHGDRRRPAGVDDRHGRPDPRARGRPPCRPRHPRRASWRRARHTARSSTPSSAPRKPHE